MDAANSFCGMMLSRVQTDKRQPISTAMLTERPRLRLDMGQLRRNQR
jgi:hypothetical protein